VQLPTTLWLSLFLLIISFKKKTQKQQQQIPIITRKAKAYRFFFPCHLFFFPVLIPLFFHRPSSRTAAATLPHTLKQTHKREYNLHLSLSLFGSCGAVIISFCVSFVFIIGLSAPLLKKTPFLLILVYSFAFGQQTFHASVQLDDKL
jgi:uncharacterized membrane protein YbaN (DUF454 family)